MKHNKLYKLFKNKKVIITGHSGFKGSWLTFWLKKLGANILGLSIDVPTKPSLFKILELDKIKSKKIDIRNFNQISNEINKFKPDFIFHLAAQAIVKKSYQDPLKTFSTNILGTMNILESLRLNKKKETIVVLITSDKSYKNFETNRAYKETDVLGGEDPYGASKSGAEILINSYIKSFFSNKKNNNYIAIARAGNVIGGGDWSEERLLPDCMKSWLNNKIVKIRNPLSTRPWQHVLDVINGYLTLAIGLKLNKNLHGHAFNFGPNMNNNYRVIDVLNKTKKIWPLAKWKIIGKKKFQENRLLKLNNTKAKKILGWKPKLNFEKTIKLTVDWYKFFFKNKKLVRQKTFSQISFFEKI